MLTCWNPLSNASPGIHARLHALLPPTPSLLLQFDLDMKEFVADTLPYLTEVSVAGDSAIRLV